MNQTILVGRLTSDPVVEETENGKKRTMVIVAVNRPFKSLDGKYETDFIKCILWNQVAEHTCEYCKTGDTIGIKGRIQTSNYEVDGEKKYSMEVIAEKITFLSSKKEEKKSKEE